MRIFIAILLLISIGCSQTKKKENQIDTSSIRSKDNVAGFIENNNKILNFIFPDTVYAKIKTRGVLQYDLQLDDSLSRKLKDRFVFLYVSPKYVEGGSKEIEKEIHTIYKDTIGDGNYFFEVSFEDKGEHIFSLAIEDHLIIEPDIDTVGMNYGRGEVLIWHPVFVK